MSWASETLTITETAIKDLASAGGVKSYSINGRSFTRENLSELMKLRRELQLEVSRENSTSEFLLADFSGQASHRRFELG